MHKEKVTKEKVHPSTAAFEHIPVLKSPLRCSPKGGRQITRTSLCSDSLACSPFRLRSSAAVMGPHLKSARILRAEAGSLRASLDRG